MKKLSTITNKNIKTVLYIDEENERLVLKENNITIQKIPFGKDYDNFIMDLLTNESNNVICNDFDFYENMKDEIDYHDLKSHCFYKLIDSKKFLDLDRLMKDYIYGMLK